MNFSVSLPLMVFIALASSRNGVEGCPYIISRQQWGARDPTQETLINNAVSKYVVHHTDGQDCFDINECSAVVRGIQDYHMDGKGWWDIGYNFLIGGDGNIYEGRGWGVQGAHAGHTETNKNSIGVSMIGDFSLELPTQAALYALTDLLYCSINGGHLESTYDLIGHRDVTSTTCPGDFFYNNYVDKLSRRKGTEFPECPS